jgi:hypothetical protein
MRGKICPLDSSSNPRLYQKRSSQLLPVDVRHGGVESDKLDVCSLTQGLAEKLM